mmetsp:Transcript_56087/g.97792  ORF Transcript_56087/g.97792 Transcript_56087/m.97792 type:complete len:154 (+) Transcript_56087:3-464(+)
MGCVEQGSRRERSSQNAGLQSSPVLGVLLLPCCSASVLSACSQDGPSAVPQQSGLESCADGPTDLQAWADWLQDMASLPCHKLVVWPHTEAQSPWCDRPPSQAPFAGSLAATPMAQVLLHGQQTCGVADAAVAANASGLTPWMLTARSSVAAT